MFIKKPRNGDLTTFVVLKSFPSFHLGTFIEFIIYSIYYSRIDITVILQTINTKVPVFFAHLKPQLSKVIVKTPNNKKHTHYPPSSGTP